MYEVEDGSMLSKVTRYQYIWSGGGVYIDVLEVVAGDNSGKFVAEPSLLFGNPKPEFMGAGTTEREALQEFLNRLKGISADDLYIRPPQA
jgi:hypothetical protein